MRIGMRRLLGYFLIVAIAAWFVLSIFFPEIKPGVRRATAGPSGGCPGDAGEAV